MKDGLAERLLARVMAWTAEDTARERPIIQAMAAYKYDEYRQFSPGMRYAESLALWLSQFKSSRERATAYDFVKKKLIFCSSAEMYHLVSIAYPDSIRPFLLQSVARDTGTNPWHVAQVASSVEFKKRQRQTLFLGLSDGARIDAFRRYNQGALTHEQIWQTYEVSDERVKDLLRELRKDMSVLSGTDMSDEVCKFRTIVLLDDFSGSGLSYLRREDDGSFKGKIAQFHRSITSKESAVSELVHIDGLEVVVVLYAATEKARHWIETVSRELWERAGVRSRVVVVYPLSPEACVTRGAAEAINQLIDDYYDPSVYDEHMDKGKTGDAKYGFADCGLPLVLNHNTPNNSILLLWSYEGKMVRGLFPRVQRHEGIDEGTTQSVPASSI